MTRFLPLALLTTVLILGLGSVGFDALDDTSPGDRLETRFVLGGWLLEALGLVALFLLIQGRGVNGWLDGLLAAWLAWIFRGPVLVLTVAATRAGTRVPWWDLTLRWLLIYSLCGLALAFIAQRLELQR